MAVCNFPVRGPSVSRFKLSVKSSSMARTRAPTDVRQVMEKLLRTRPIAEATRTEHLQNPKLTPLMKASDEPNSD